MAHLRQNSGSARACLDLIEGLWGDVLAIKVDLMQRVFNTIVSSYGDITIAIEDLNIRKKQQCYEQPLDISRSSASFTRD